MVTTVLWCKQLFTPISLRMFWHVSWAVESCHTMCPPLHRPIVMEQKVTPLVALMTRAHGQIKSQEPQLASHAHTCPPLAGDDVMDMTSPLKALHYRAKWSVSISLREMHLMMCYRTTSNRTLDCRFDHTWFFPALLWSRTFSTASDPCI